MRKLICFFGHKWGDWFMGLQPLRDWPSGKRWTRQCSRCGEYEFKDFAYGVKP